MKYSVYELINAAAMTAAFAASLCLYKAAFAVRLAAVFVPLLFCIVFDLIAEKKNPQLKSWSGAFANWRNYALRIAAFVVTYAAVLYFNRSGGVPVSTGCALLAAFAVDGIYGFIAAKKLDIDRLGTVENVIKNKPRAAKYISGRFIENSEKYADKGEKA